jgi:tetratricopeptide (TPR) repeat protein
LRILLRNGTTNQVRIWNLLAFLLLAGPVVGQQEDNDGLLPPVTLDRSLGVGRIRQAIAARDLALAQKEAEELRLREQTSSEPLFWAGYVALRQGHNYDAIRDLRRAESLNPNEPVLKLLAVSYYAAHQPKLFLIKIRAAQQKQPDDFAPYYYLGRYYDTDVSDYSQAADNFGLALARQPDHFRSHYYLGHCYEAQARLEQAETEYRRALELADRQGVNDGGLPYQGLARLRLAADKPDEALAFARRAVERSPRDAAAHKLLARAYWQTRRNADAVREWEISAKLDPTDASARYRLYRGYISLGETEKARSALAEYKHIAELYGTN